MKGVVTLQAFDGKTTVRLCWLHGHGKESDPAALSLASTYKSPRFATDREPPLDCIPEFFPFAT